MQSGFLRLEIDSEFNVVIREIHCLFWVISSQETYGMSEDLVPRVSSSVERATKSKSKLQGAWPRVPLPALTSWRKEAPGVLHHGLGPRFSEESFLGWSLISLEFLGSHKTSHRWCKFDSGLLELEPHPKWNLPLRLARRHFLSSFPCPSWSALESRIGVEQSYVSKMMATNCHHHHLNGVGKRVM